MSGRNDPIRLIFGGWTDIGCKAINQDAFLINDALGLLVVCDGVSQGGGGEVAAVLAAQQIESFVQLAVGRRMDDRLKRAVRVADRTVKAFRGDRQMAVEGLDLPDMKTLVVTVCAAPDHVELAWAGDCRCYRYRDGLLEQLTTDDAAGGNGGGAVTSAVGGLRSHGPNYKILTDLEAGDLLFLCSDGLYKRDKALGTTTGVLQQVVEEARAETSANEAGAENAIRASVAEASRRLVQATNPRDRSSGSEDNITVAMAFVERVPDRGPASNQDDDTSTLGQTEEAPPAFPVPAPEPISTTLPKPPLQSQAPPPKAKRDWFRPGLWAAIVVAAIALFVGGKAVLGPNDPMKDRIERYEEEVDGDLAEWPFDARCDALARDSLQGVGQPAFQDLLTRCARSYVEHFSASSEGGPDTEETRQELRNKSDLSLRRYVILNHLVALVPEEPPTHEAGPEPSSEKPPDENVEDAVVDSESEDAVLDSGAVFVAMRTVLDRLPASDRADEVLKWISTDDYFPFEGSRPDQVEEDCWVALRAGLDAVGTDSKNLEELRSNLESKLPPPTPTPTRTLTPTITITATPTATETPTHTPSIKPSPTPRTKNGRQQKGTQAKTVRPKPSPPIVTPTFKDKVKPCSSFVLKPEEQGRSILLTWEAVDQVDVYRIRCSPGASDGELDAELSGIGETTHRFEGVANGNWKCVIQAIAESGNTLCEATTEVEVATSEAADEGAGLDDCGSLQTAVCAYLEGLGSGSEDVNTAGLRDEVERILRELGDDAEICIGVVDPSQKIIKKQKNQDDPAKWLTSEPILRKNIASIGESPCGVVEAPSREVN